MTFKVDTGADVTLVPWSAVSDVGGICVEKTGTKLYGVGQQIKILGKATVCLKYGQRDVEEVVYITKDTITPLLGKTGIEKLGLVKKLFEVHTKNWVQEFKDVFEGLGTYKEEYSIELKPKGEPYAISTPRIVPIHLREKVKEELNKMEMEGVIAPVEKATDWCAPMVIAPKKDGIRICVDLGELNKSVKRQVHPIPGIDNSLSQLTGAKFFTKLDANSGFWQIPLSKESQDLTTFLTPFGRYKFLRLPFGITSAPEFFQKKMNQLLVGMKNCIVHMDDILIWGKTITEHDQCVRNDQE